MAASLRAKDTFPRSLTSPFPLLLQKSQSLFAPAAQFGFRKNYQPGHYNMRFKPSQGIDGVYVATNAPYHGPDGAEPVSTTVLPH